ncbi:MAG: response regulator [Deltaproteobacteria bacterium]|nr:response regulator [Deltaproteobacteria bacterium]
MRGTAKTLSRHGIGSAARRRAGLVAVVLRVLAASALAVMTSGLLQPKNSRVVVLATYTPVFAALGAAWLLHRRGRPRAAAWIVVGGVFALILAVVFFFGGLMANNAVAFILVVMIAGTTLGTTEALVVAVLAAVACGVAAVVESRGALPPSISPVTLFNAWTAITVTLVVAAILHHLAVRAADDETARANLALADLRESQRDNETRSLFAGALTQLAERALTALDPRELYDFAATLLRDTLGVEDVLIAGAPREGGLELLASAGGARSVSLDPRLLAPLAGSDSFDLGDSEVQPLLRALHVAPASGGGICGVRGPHGVSGALAVVTDGPRALVPAEKQLLATAAGILGGVMSREVMALRAERAQKLEVVGRIASAVAHDFNNVLAVVVSTSEELRHLHGSDASTAEMLDDVRMACERATLLTRQLLAFGGRASGPPERVDLTEFVASLVPMLRRLVGETISLEAALATEHLVVEIARGSFEQVLLNLVVNAREAMPDGGRIQISLRAIGHSAQLDVSDTGVGIDEVTRGRVFDPFFTTKVDGTGLGLATVAEIVQRFGGNVRVESVPRQGTTFSVMLPLAYEEATPTRAVLTASGKAVGGASLRVLLVDDHDLVRVSTARLLERAGHTVVAVSTGADALARAATDPFDVVVTDVAMAGMTGPELVDELARRGSTTPVVMVSGHVDAAPVTSTPNPTTFLPKPFTQHELSAAIDRVLGRATEE